MSLWVVNKDYGVTKNDSSERIAANLRKNEVAVAYPQMGVHIEQAG